MQKIYKESGQSNEVITPLIFRGERILLPELATKMSGFNDEGEYVVKFADGKLIVEKFKKQE